MNVPNVSVDWKISLGSVLTIGTVVVGLTLQWARQGAAIEVIAEKQRAQQVQIDGVVSSLAGVQLQLREVSTNLDNLSDLVAEVRTDLKQEYRR